MNNKVITGIVLAALVLVGTGAVVLSQQNNDQGGAANYGSSTNKESNNSEGESSKDVQEVSTVTYENFAVTQPHIKIKKGTTVTWVNEDTAKHDVTPDDEANDFMASKLFGKGETHQVTFNTVGTYEYHCSPHPYMKGVVEVVES